MKGLSIAKIAFLRGETKQVSCTFFLVTKPRNFFSGQSDWLADNSRKVRLAGMPATAGSLPPMLMYLREREMVIVLLCFK